MSLLLNQLSLAYHHLAPHPHSACDHIHIIPGLQVQTICSWLLNFSIPCTFEFQTLQIFPFEHIQRLRNECRCANPVPLVTYPGDWLHHHAIAAIQPVKVILTHLLFPHLQNLSNYRVLRTTFLILFASFNSLTLSYLRLDFLMHIVIVSLHPPYLLLIVALSNIFSTVLGRC